MMRTLFTLFLSICLSATVNAAVPQYAYRITFRDKQGAPALTTSPPWLSARAMARRANFGISLDSTDRPVSQLYIDSVLKITGGKFHNRSRWLNQCVILVTDTSRMATIRTFSFVGSVTWVGFFASGLHREHPGPNPKTEPEIHQAPLSTAKQTGSAAYYGSAYGQVSMVHGDTLHDQGFRGKGKLIAILDQGFIEVDTHPGFDSVRRQGRFLETYNFMLDTSYVYGYDTHGLNCLSTMAGCLPGRFVGTAPDADYALYLTEDGNFTDALYELDNMVAGMERADSIGADIISSSLGYNIFTSPVSTAFLKSELDGKTTIVARAANLAVAKGIFYVNSAGNEGGNSWNFLLSPSDADSALTIGAVTQRRAPAGFSSPGPNAAGRVKPDVSMQGDPAVVLVTSGGVGASSGTSFSAPQAAGYAACLMQAFPTLPPAIIRKAFAHISHLYPSSTPQLGYGIPDFRKAQAFLRQFIPDSSHTLTISPNPFVNAISVRLPEANSTFEFVLTDMLGRSIGFQTERNGMVVNISPDTPVSGIYLLRAVVDGHMEIRKLLRL